MCDIFNFFRRHAEEQARRNHTPFRAGPSGRPHNLPDDRHGRQRKSGFTLEDCGNEHPEAGGYVQLQKNLEFDAKRERDY